MSETCVDCLERRLTTGCNCFDAEPITDEAKQEHYINNGNYGTMYEFVLECMPTDEELDVLAEEAMYDSMSEIDMHEHQ